VLLLEVVVTEVDEAEVGEEVEVELRPLSVKAMSPLPSKTIPRPSWQQAGSLSQQKLPSLQTFTRGRKPSEPPSEGVRTSELRTLICANQRDGYRIETIYLP
jgi:hypothetical protein